MPAPSPLGEELRSRRNAQKLSLREVERRSGINSGYLSQLERGDITNPTPSVLKKVADAYSVPFQVVMRWAGYVEDGLSPNAQRALSVLGDDFTDDELRALQAVLDVLRSKGSANFSAVHRSDLQLDDAATSAIQRSAKALLREVDQLNATGPVDLDAVTAFASLVRTGDVELSLDERRGLRARFGDMADWAIRQLQGVLHYGSQEVYVNPSMYELKKNFVLAHEIGHWVLPDHRLVYAHLDDNSRLSPEFNDLLERQANQFGIELLARGDQMRATWDDSAPGAAALDRLSAQYAVSLQAVARHVGENSSRPLAIAVAHRGGKYGPLQPPRLFCSATWEARMGWKLLRAPESALRDRLADVAAGIPLEALLCDDLAGRNVPVQVDGLSTPWACFLLCWLPTAPRRRLWRPGDR